MPEPPALGAGRPFMEYFKILNLAKEPSPTPDPEFFYESPSTWSASRWRWPPASAGGHQRGHRRAGTGSMTCAASSSASSPGQEREQSSPSTPTSTTPSTLANILRIPEPEIGEKSEECKEMIKNFLYRRSLEEG